MNKKQIEKLIENTKSIFQEYYGVGRRYYHTFDHIKKMYDDFLKYKLYENLFEDQVYDIIDAIALHDIVYEPFGRDNEEESVKFYKSIVEQGFKSLNHSMVEQLILSTKIDYEIKTPTEAVMNLLDLMVFLGDPSDLARYERNIFKEYSFVHWLDYYNGRMQILPKVQRKILAIKEKLDGRYKSIFKQMIIGVDHCMSMLEFFRPNIGIYIGSFNPFHIGHMNVIKKAEETFDKIIIVKAVNMNKSNNKEFAFPQNIHNNYEVILTSDSVKKIVECVCDTTTARFSLIRGLRSSYDLNDEQNYLAAIRDMGVEIPMVHILCDAKDQHISSTMARTMERYDPILFDKWTKF